MFALAPITNNMIGLVEGELYRVLKKCDKKNDPDWWLIERENKQGYAPRNYLKLLEDI